MKKCGLKVHQQWNAGERLYNMIDESVLVCIKYNVAVEKIISEREENVSLAKY